MQLNLNIPILGPDGNVVNIVAPDGKKQPTRSLGEHVAGFLVQGEQKTNVLKIFGWAQKLVANEPIELDVPDAQLFEEIITNCNVILLIRANVLQTMLIAKNKCTNTDAVS